MPHTAPRASVESVYTSCIETLPGLVLPPDDESHSPGCFVFIEQYEVLAGERPEPVGSYPGHGAIVKDITVDILYWDVFAEGEPDAVSGF